MRYGDLTYPEIRDRAREGYIAIVPTGCTEQQGLHLPVDFDTWFAEELMLAASVKAAADGGPGSLVLPVMPFGPAREHRSFGSGYVDLPIELHQQLLEAVLSSLKDQGFERILVWKGCGGHDLAPVIERFNAAGGALARLPAQPFHQIWCRLVDPSVPDGHAAGFATSICLHLRPDAVRRDQIERPNVSEFDWGEENLDFARISSTGAIGDPTLGGAELGRRLWEESVEAAAGEIRAFAGASA